MTRETDQLRDLSLVTDEEGEPRLRGRECVSCGEVTLPVERCPNCGGDLREIAFDRRAELETQTVVHVAPPKFDTPYAIGYVYLRPGNVRAFTPLVGDPDAFAPGMEVELTAATMGGESTWAFAPAGDVDA